jgi:cytoskeletal protein CcmA (bactofilin family)
MFVNNMGKNNQMELPSHNQIGTGTNIEGDIKSNGDVRIDGILTGTIQTKGRLVVGATGSIEGSIHCQNALIEGSIKGKITVSELLSLKATAKLTGDIVTNKLAIEPGATFTGSCNMGAVIKDIKQGERTESRPEEKAAAY